MLTKVDIQTNAGQYLSLHLDSEDREFYVEDISGLDPVKAEMVSTGVSAIDGEQYQASRVGPRNLIFTVGMQDLGINTIRALRHRLYTFFMPKSEVTMTFYDDEYPPLRISGRVESLEAPPFQRDPQAVISVLCFDPAFYEINPNISSALVPASGTLTRELAYDGTVATGVVMSIKIQGSSGATNSVQLTMQRSDGIVEMMEILHPLQLNDLLTIDTNPGKKGVTLLRNGQSDSILYGLTYQSDWINLTPGVNILQFTGAGGSTGSTMITLKWLNKHGGL